MNAHYAPLSDALAPVLCTATAAMDAFARQIDSLGPLPAENACGNKRHTGTGGASVLGNTSAGVEVKNASEAQISAPADLRGFVQAQTVTEVARVLGMSRKTAWRLRKDQWPRDLRSVLTAWDAHKGLSTQQQSGWFLRRVHVGGVVLHVGRRWTSAGLPARAGQTLAVARVDAQTLLVQTLDLPSARFTLSVKG